MSTPLMPSTRQWWAHHRADVHVRARALLSEEARVDRRQAVHQPFPGRGNWVATNMSQPRSGSSARWVSRIRADAVTG
jgi:hypothetical protein